MIKKHLTTLAIALILSPAANAANPATFSLVGDWEVRISVDEPRVMSTTVRVKPPALVAVMNEQHTALPLFNPAAGGWICQAPDRVWR